MLLATEYFAADGSLTRPTGGYAQIINDVVEDDTTRTVVTRYLDADGNALIGPDGSGATVSVYTSEQYLIDPDATASLDAGLQKLDGHRRTGSIEKNLLLSQSVYS